jgi:hypothetical protein
MNAPTITALVAITRHFFIRELAKLQGGAVSSDDMGMTEPTVSDDDVSGWLDDLEARVFGPSHQIGETRAAALVWRYARGLKSAQPDPCAFVITREGLPFAVDATGRDGVTVAPLVGSATLKAFRNDAMDAGVPLFDVDFPSDWEAIAAVAIEFPDYVYDLPNLAPYTCEAWHNDTCPKFTHGGDGYNAYLWCDFANVDAREFCAESVETRFILEVYTVDQSMNEGEPVIQVEAPTLDAMRDAIAAGRNAWPFAVTLPAVLAEG